MLGATFLAIARQSSAGNPYCHYIFCIAFRMHSDNHNNWNHPRAAYGLTLSAVSNTDQYGSGSLTKYRSLLNHFNQVNAALLQHDWVCIFSRHSCEKQYFAANDHWNPGLMYCCVLDVTAVSHRHPYDVKSHGNHAMKSCACDNHVHLEPSL